MLLSRLMFVAFAALLIVPTRAVAQVEQVMESANPCECTIVVERIAEIGIGAGQNSPRETASLVRLANGWHVLTPSYAPGQISLFASDGGFRRAIGTLGKGPGELQDPSALFAAAGDSVLLFDAGNMRFVLLDGSMEIRRTAPARLLVYDLADLGDSWLAAGKPLGVDSWAPLHRLDRSGRILGSLGGKVSGSKGVERRVHVAGNGDVVVAHVNAYRIEVYSPDLQLRRVLERRVKWFEPYDELTSAESRAGKPSLLDVTTDEHGRLWILLRRVRPDYKPSKTPPQADGRSTMSLEPALRRYEHILEIVDIESGRLLRSGSINRVARGFADSSHLYTVAVGSDGAWVMEVLRLSLREQS